MYLVPFLYRCQIAFMASKNSFLSLDSTVIHYDITGSPDKHVRACDQQLGPISPNPSKEKHVRTLNQRSILADLLSTVMLSSWKSQTNRCASHCFRFIERVLSRGRLHSTASPLRVAVCHDPLLFFFPGLDAPLLPLRQSDMCLVCIAFASWVLKTANPQAGDAWKAGML